MTGSNSDYAKGLKALFFFLGLTRSSFVFGCVFEFLDSAAKASHQFRNLSPAEQQQNDQDDKDNLPWSNL